MDKTAIQALILLTISEYSGINTAFNSECMLVDLFQQMNDEQMVNYQELASVLDDFNKKHMHDLIGKFPTE